MKWRPTLARSRVANASMRASMRASMARSSNPSRSSRSVWARAGVALMAAPWRRACVPPARRTWCGSRPRSHGGGGRTRRACRRRPRCRRRRERSEVAGEPGEEPGDGRSSSRPCDALGADAAAHEARLLDLAPLGGERPARAVRVVLLGLPEGQPLVGQIAVGATRRFATRWAEPGPGWGRVTAISPRVRHGDRR